MSQKSGLDLLLYQYNDSTNLKAYIKCFLDEFAEVRQALADTIQYRYLKDAYGVMVDDVAYIVGASRIIYGAEGLGFFGFYENPSALPAGDDNVPGEGGILRSDLDKESGDYVRTDTQLKDAIRARIIKIVGSCTIEELIMYCELILGREIDFKIVAGHKTLDFIVNEKLSVQDKILLAHMIPDFKPVGVTATLEDISGNIALVYNSKVYPPENL